MEPVFKYIPIVGNNENGKLSSIRLRGVSTKHGSTDTDGGLIYAKLTGIEDGIGIQLFNSYRRGFGDIIAQGIMEEFGEPFEISPVVEGEDTPPVISGDAVIDSFSSSVDLVLVVTFATDVDIQSDPADMENFPGYDPDFGLASVFARAMETILTSALPAAIPALYPGKINPFSPIVGGLILPDVTLIENPASLKSATADLAKAMSWEQAEHNAEAADIIRGARSRYVSEMKDVADANAIRNDDVGKTESTGVQFTSFTRG